MSSVVSSLKKDESIYNKQLLILNSANRLSNESETSFTNTFTLSERIAKVELLDCNIPNTLYNINNDNAIMNVDVSILNGNINKEKLVVSDTEIQNNVIVSSNVINGSVNKYNYITSSNLLMTDIKKQGLSIYSLGLFQNNLVSFYNTDNINTVSNLEENSGTNNVFCSSYNIDQTFKWRFKITGNISYAKMQVSEDSIYIMGKTASDVNFYNTTDVASTNNLIMSSDGIFLCKYNFDGNLIWRFKCQQYDTGNLQNFYFAIYNSSIYISSTCKSSVNDLCYDIDDIAVEPNPVPTLLTTTTASFLVKYNIDGTYTPGNLETLYDINTVTSNTIVTSIANNPGGDGSVFIALNFDTEISFLTPLICNGKKNICIVKYSNNIDLIGRIRIGGSSSDDNCLISLDDTSLYTVGNFTSNPVVFYKSDDSLDRYLKDIVLSNKTMFVAKYPIDFIENTSGLEFDILMNSSDYIKPSDLKVGDRIFISTTFKSTVKFHDVSGYVENKDITNLETDDFSQCIVSYDLDGNFIDRIYNNNSGSNNVIELSSSKLYSIGSFTVDNDYYNINNSIDVVLTQKENNNGIITSYIYSNTGFILNYDILGNTIIFKDLVDDDIGYLLNINTFAETLGFETSQKFIPSIFGNSISWQTLNINLDNSIISFTFSIANLDTQSFDDMEISLVIDSNRYASYTPYNLVYELNKKFNIIRTNTSFLNQDFNAFYYNQTKNIFYIRIDVNGTFTIVDTNLSNMTGMNMILTPYLSPLVVISDIVVGDIDDTIKDNTKLTLKLTDNIETEIVNNVSFAEAFPSIISNSLIITAGTPGSSSNIYADTSIIGDSLSDVTVGDTITFDYPWVPGGPVESPLTGDWSDVAMSANGEIISAVKNQEVYISLDYGSSWNGFTNQNIKSGSRITMSSDGQYQTIVSARSNILVSNNKGISWNIVDSYRYWRSVSMSSSGKYQTACASNDLPNPGIYTSDDYGISWIKVFNNSTGLRDVAISGTGQYQVAVEYFGFIFVSNDYGKFNTWNRVGVSRSWANVEISDSGDRIIALSNNSTTFYVSTDQVNNWFDWIDVSTPSIYRSFGISPNGEYQLFCGLSGGVNTTYLSTNYGSSWVSLTLGDIRIEKYAISSDGQKQIAVASSGIIYLSLNEGINWIPWTTTGFDIGNWTSVAMSSDGLIQTVVRSGIISQTINLGKTWTDDAVSGTWISVAMSSDGIYQTIVPNNGNIHISINSGINWNPVFDSHSWKCVDMSSDGMYQTAVAFSDFIYRSSNYGNDGSWVQVSVSNNWTSVSVSSSGKYQTAVTSTGYIFVSDNYGLTWSLNLSNVFDWIDIDMSSDGMYQTAVSSGNVIYRSSNYGVDWVPTSSDSINWQTISVSSSGQFQTAGSLEKYIYMSNDYGLIWENVLTSISQFNGNDMALNGKIQTIVGIGGYIYTNVFAIEPIILTVKYINNTGNTKHIVFNETSTIENRYELLNDFNMEMGLNYTIKLNITSPVQDLFITPGNYTIPEFITQVNEQIHNINPSFLYDDNGNPLDPFTYNSKTKKITFNPHYLGAEENIIIITDLLKTMGFTELPINILEPIHAQNITNKNLSGSNNLYIKSDILGRFMKEPTTSNNSKFNNVIATLGYDNDNDSYKLIDSNKNEIFLSQKVAMNVIDIKIINDKSEIVNLNGGTVSINVKLVKA
jgi:hypothetical protein